LGRHHHVEFTAQDTVDVIEQPIHRLTKPSGIASTGSREISL
jgi:hypothetical protein